MYRVKAGTLQPLVIRGTPHFMQHFGLAEYDARKPVVKERGEITEEDARLLLEKIW